jgi:hypothetical protein
MQDLKLMIRFNFDGKNELEKIIDEVAKKHNLEVKSNLGQVKVDVDSIGKGFTNITNKITTAVTKFGFFTQGLSQAGGILRMLADETVNLGREQIRSDKLVEGAVKATGAAAGFTTAELKRMANQLQDDTNFGDEKLLAKVTSVLLTFKQVQGDVFKEAQSLILDMSEALGQDLQQASIQVGKALQDPIQGVSALRRVGVQLSEQQEQQIKDFMAVNKVAEAQKVILQELNSQFGGQAKNVVDPFIQLQNTWGDIKETIGIALLPGLNALASSTKNWLESLKPATSELEKVTDESNNQQAEFFSLTSAYETLRFKQGETLESSTALKDIIDTLNTKYGDYLGNIDLATTKYQDFKTAVSNATLELQKEAMTKAFLAKRQDITDKITDVSADLVNDVMKERKKLEIEQKQLQQAMKDEAEARKNFEQDENTQSREALADAIDWRQQKQEQLENAQADFDQAVENINSKAKAKLTGLELELNLFDESSTSLLKQLLGDEDEDTTNGSTSLIANQDDIDKQLQAIKDSLKTKQQLLTDNYNAQTELINKNVADETEKTNLLTALDEKYANDSKALKHQEFQEELAIAENKKQLGILTYQELKTTVDEYYNWVKANYDKDSKEYVQALNMKHNADLRYGQETKKLNDKLLKDTKETWQTALKMFDLGLIPYQQLQTAFQNYKNMLQSTSADADLTEDQINKITIAVKELDNQMEKISQNQDWLHSFVDNINEQFDEIDSQSYGIAGNVASSWANTFARIQRSGFKFKRDMKALWKDLANAVIAEINRMIARWLVLMAIKGIGNFFTGFMTNAANDAIGTALEVTGNAEGGYISGPGGPKDDVIPAWLSNGEFVINAEKTAIFRPLLEYLNYTPMASLKTNLSLPKVNMPAIPKVAYSSGGYANHPGFDLSRIEEKLDKLDKLEKVINELQELKKKDYTVQVSTKFRGVEFAKEVNKAQSQYQRIMR